MCIKSTALIPVGAGSLEGGRLKVVMKAGTGRKAVVETGEERGGGDRSLHVASCL
jgi:hypothetical protein